MSMRAHPAPSSPPRERGDTTQTRLRCARLRQRVDEAVDRDALVRNTEGSAAFGGETAGDREAAGLLVREVGDVEHGRRQRIGLHSGAASPEPGWTRAYHGSPGPSDRGRVRDRASRVRSRAAGSSRGGRILLGLDHRGQIAAWRRRERRGKTRTASNPIFRSRWRRASILTRASRSRRTAVGGARGRAGMRS